MPGWLLFARRALSLRGRVALATGTGLVVAALLTGQQILLRLGVLLLSIPLVCLVVIGRARHELHCSRVVSPARVTAGEFARISVRVYNDATTPSSVLLAEDRLPGMAALPRFVLERIEPAGDREITYQTRARVRGRYPIGPLTVRMADPFGMCERGRSLEGTDWLVVIPVVEPLPALALSGHAQGDTENRPTTQPTAGAEDVRLREYVQGDPINRIHWGATARRGELMVRQEEHPPLSRATILLDIRERAHRGLGMESSVEWVISACASLTAHLAGRGYAVRVLLDREVGLRAGVPMEVPAAPGAEALLLDALAVLENAPNAPLRDVAKELGRPGAGSLVIAVVGDLSDEDAEDLSRRRVGGTTAIVFLLRTHTWDRQSRGRGTDHSAVLRTGGWRTVTVEHGDTVAEAWNAAFGGAA